MPVHLIEEGEGRQPKPFLERLLGARDADYPKLAQAFVRELDEGRVRMKEVAGTLKASAPLWGQQEYEARIDAAEKEICHAIETGDLRLAGAASYMQDVKSATDDFNVVIAAWARQMKQAWPLCEERGYAYAGQAGRLTDAAENLHTARQQMPRRFLMNWKDKAPVQTLLQEYKDIRATYETHDFDAARLASGNTDALRATNVMLGKLDLQHHNMKGQGWRKLDDLKSFKDVLGSIGLQFDTMRTVQSPVPASAELLHIPSAEALEKALSFEQRAGVERG